MTKRRLRRLRREIEHTLLFCVADLSPCDAIEHGDIEKAVKRLPDEESELERLQVEMRYCLNVDGSLAEVLGDEDFSDRVIRHLVLAMEVEITSRLTGEPKRRLPFELPGFRGG